MNRMNNTTIGLDIAKNVFHYAELNRNGRVTGSGMLKRNKVLSHFHGHWRQLGKLVVVSAAVRLMTCTAV